MTTKNEMLTALNTAVHALREAGAKYNHEDWRYWELTTHNMGSGSGWSIVWRDTRNGGVAPVVHLGDNKRRVTEQAWQIVAVADTIRFGGMRK